MPKHQCQSYGDAVVAKIYASHKYAHGVVVVQTQAPAIKLRLQHKAIGCFGNHHNCLCQTHAQLI